MGPPATCLARRTRRLRGMRLPIVYASTHECRSHSDQEDRTGGSGTRDLVEWSGEGRRLPQRWVRLAGRLGATWTGTSRTQRQQQVPLTVGAGSVEGAARRKGPFKGGDGGAMRRSDEGSSRRSPRNPARGKVEVRWRVDSVLSAPSGPSRSLASCSPAKHEHLKVTQSLHI
jgi:hypothetical protein